LHLQLFFCVEIASSLFVTRSQLLVTNSIDAADFLLFRYTIVCQPVTSGLQWSILLQSADETWTWHKAFSSYAESDALMRME